MQFYTFGSGYPIVREGECKRELILLINGRLQVTVKSDQCVDIVLSELVAGDYFGDYHLFFGTESEVTLTVIEFSEVLILSYSSLIESLAEIEGSAEFDGSALDSSSDGSETENEDNSEEVTISSHPDVTGHLNESEISPGLLRLDPVLLGLHHDILAQDMVNESKLEPTQLLVDDRQGFMRGQVHLNITSPSHLCESISTHDGREQNLTISKHHKSFYLAPFSPENASVQATVQSHSGNLKRYVRAKNTLENTRGKKKIDEMMQELQTLAHKKCTISPSHPLRLGWDLLSIAGILYYVLCCPVR